jgi:hypothetical protein
MAHALTDLKKRVAARKDALGYDPTPALVAKIASEAEWLEPPETFLVEDHALLFKLQVENNIRLARFLRMTGELIERQLVEQQAAAAATELAQAFEGFPDRLAQELAAITDPKQIRQRLREVIAEVLQQFRENWNPRPPEYRERDPDAQLVNLEPR